MKVRDQGDDVREALRPLGETPEDQRYYADQPFATGPDLVLQQVGWRDAMSGALFRLGERVPIERAPGMHVRAVYEVNGHHYRDPSPDGDDRP
jgi:hypothetical protein